MNAKISLLSLVLLLLCKNAWPLFPFNSSPLMANNKRGETFFIANDYYSSPTWKITKVSSTGKIDTSFGDQGISTLPFKYDESAFCTVSHFKIQGDGFLVLGRGQDNDSSFIKDIFITRLNSAGKIDSSFSDSGRLSLDPIIQKLFGAEKYRGFLPHDLVILNDGSFLLLVDVLKEIDSESDEDIQAIVAFTPNAEVDTSFGTNGYLTLNDDKRWRWPAVFFNPETNTFTTFLFKFQKVSEGIYQLKVLVRNLDPETKQLLEGAWENVGAPGKNTFGFYTGPVSVFESDKGWTILLSYYPNKPAVLKLLKGGTYDPNFGVKGILTVSAPMDFQIYSVDLMHPLGENHFISGAFSNSEIDHQRFPGVIKVTARGEIDMSFGEKGVLVQAPKLGDSYQITCSADSSTCMGAYQYMRGTTPNDSGLYQCIDKFNVDGKLDSTYGEDGKLCLLLSDPSP